MIDEQKQSNTFRSAFMLLVMLFFMWGFITSLNDILIPHLKSVFELSYTEAMLIQFCFFGSYFAMSMPASLIIDKFGYTKGIVTGLVVMGFGALLFYPASVIVFYPLFLFALFILASGITILQVAANPFVAAVGDPRTASSRLNLSQGFNSLAHTIAPIFGTYLILNDPGESLANSAEAVQLPYIGLAVSLFLLALFFSRISLPSIQKAESSSSIETGSIWNHKQLTFGVIAIFLYVGIEVSIGGFLVNFFGEPDIANMPEKIAGNYVSYYWGGAMVGRFVGSALLQKIKAERLLAIAAIGALTLVLITIMTTGHMAMWAILLVGLCNSVMFPNIFTLSISGLGKQTSRGSGLLVMAIVGGAIVPLIQGLLADSFGVQISFSVGFLCYGYILFYALRGYRLKEAII
ncbi:MAG: sugar MFS transporter [Flavobacteriales bacterium]|nr:sugar MFS transporter [Flavobacteriales bacterium]